MKYLLLGGSGFIGRHLAAMLCKEHEVIVADRAAFVAGMDMDTVSFCEFDFATDDFEPLLTGVDCVFHLVSTVLPDVGTENLIEEISANVLPTIRLLDAIASRRGIKLYYFSTGGAIYGEYDDRPASEESFLQPICKYGVHKLAIEKYMHLYHIYHGVDYRIFRPANPYSSKLYEGRTQGALPIFLDKILLGKPIEIWGDGNILRDFVHINDLLSAVRAIMGYCGDQRVFNIGSGSCISLNDLIALIAGIAKRPLPDIAYTNGRACDTRYSELDISLIGHCTDWRPAISLADGIRMCVADRQSAS
ncbi:MAG: NAD-dependent epimerase/dehydratase family protein [Oscillospiraceae bacterium]|nr:NAD-dependent epimerase/dehydratase family protein [Oscillospiraceae bacterium]